MSTKPSSPTSPQLKKRRLNIRLMTCIVVPAVLMVVGITQVHSLQIKRNASALLEQSDRAESKGDFAKAEEYLRLYLGYRPKDAKALAKYALTRDARARTVDDRIQTVQALDAALRADPGRRDIRRRLVEVAMSLKSFPVAQMHLKTLLGRQSPGETVPQHQIAAGDGELEYLLGQCAEGETDYASAAGWYKDAVAHAPQQIDGYLRLADVLRNRLSDPIAADRVMDARQVADGLIAFNGESSRAHFERARYRRQNKIDGAEQDIARALELSPKDADVLLTAAAFAIERGALDVARRHLTTGLENNRRNWKLSDAMAWIARRSGQPKEAEEYLHRGIEASDDPEGRRRLQWTLADLLIDEGKWADAKRVTDGLSEQRVKPELVKYLSARIHAGESKWIDASKELEAIYPLLLAETPALAYTANLVLATCYEQLGDIDRRYAAYRRAVSLDSEGAAGQLGLAGTLAAMGKVDEALAAYRPMIGKVPIAGTAAARLMILRNLRRPAEGHGWQEVEQVLAKAAEAMPDSNEVAILSAEASVAQGKWDLARDRLVKARDRRLDQVALWISLAELADRRETPAAALAILDEAQRRLGDRVELQVARTNHWAKQGGSEATKALAELERNLASLSASDQDKLLRELTDAHLRLGNSVIANRLIGHVVERRPFDLGLRFIQFDLALQVGDKTAIERTLEGIRTTENQLQATDEKGGAFWQCARARFLIWSAAQKGRGSIRQGELDQARVHLAEAGSRRPSWSQVPLAEAQIDDLVGNQDGAIKSYLRAIELGLLAPDVIRRTVQLLFDRRRYDQADELIRKLQADGLASGNPQLERLAAEVSLQANDRARALVQARNAIPVDSNDYRDHLWLGQILWAAGEPAKAEPELRRAVELGGEAPDAWITLVQYLARTGRKEQARAALEQARTRLSGEQAPLVLAHCFEEVGDLDQARAQLKTALAARPDDIATLRAAASLAIATASAPEAEKDLRAIIALSSKAPDDADWARRLLAILLASSGNRRQSLEAFQLLGLADEGASYVPRAGESIDEIRAKAKVLALRDNRESRRAAIRAVQSIVDREPPAADDQYLLTQLYEADGNWSKAHEQLQALLANNGENPLYLAHNTLVLLRQGETDEAQSWLEKLEKLEPKTLRTIELKARILKAQGRAVQAVPLLEALVQGKDDQVVRVAKLLEDLGQVAAAERLYRRFASQKQQPQAILVLAGFLGRQNRLAEAIDLCESAWASCPPDAVALATVAVLFSAPIDLAQCRRAAESFERELKKTPQNAAIVFHLGNVRCLEGRYEEAEKLYRQSYALDPNNSGPLSNLGWLLARRDGNGIAALKLISEGILHDGPTPDLLEARAIAYLTTGQSDAAVKDLEDAIAVRPSPLKYLHLAEAYLTASRRKEATTALQSAKTAGLNADTLSPLEREKCRQVLAQLSQD
jgi:tetratricopeptide (TPR) repeat protein